MSSEPRARAAAHAPDAATRFAALGDPTRLGLVTRLGNGSRYSLTQLAAGQAVTRQAISKHLRVLERAHIVRCQRRGREVLYALDPDALPDLRAWIDRLAAQWDQALARLKSFVED